MSIPTSTYRIQFRNGMTFDRATALIPYLKQLGISHLYTSPIFTATRGSTHGYDVTDANEIEPAIGGRAGFDNMVRALKQAGIGLIIDIVPNHMAASLENRWWRDVIEHGENSRYARHFDIDWTRPLTLPFLGDSFENCVKKGEITIKRDPDGGRPAFAFYENFYPLTPASWQGRETEILSLTGLQPLISLHESQPWRLMCWREAPRNLSYRRFFEITGLAGVRVEVDGVFMDTHRLILELVHSGAVAGLRVDHVDGLADPQGYLEQLRQAAGADCYITVEKILGDGEQLPVDWPVSGTTGYEFIAALSHALVDGAKLPQLREAYREAAGEPAEMTAELRAAKGLMADRNFAGEFNTLLQLALKIAAHCQVTSGHEEFRVALRELLIAFPVYRTYGTALGMPADDQTRLQQVVAAIKQNQPSADNSALDFIILILTSDIGYPEAVLFRTRFQQLTGPLMAKSVEDTLFYRQHMALALNEVGAEPVPTDFSPERFHQEMSTRRQRQPDGLSGTSTHDTKRGEDARARLYTLTEAPEQWAECVARWRGMHQSQVAQLEDGPAPEPAVEWMLYQALAGAWDIKGNEDLSLLKQRFIPFVEKALREAKLRTDWADSNTAYENAVLEYARYLLSPTNKAFHKDFSTALQPFIRAGGVNSLSQCLIKLTAPGVPDIYQGSEALNFSLVDPDNRREPDFATLQQSITARVDWTSLPDSAPDTVKQQVIATLLHLRQLKPSLFREGGYLPLTASGNRAKHLIAFARQENEDALIVIVPRLVFSLESGGWMDADVALPASLAKGVYRNIFTGKEISLTDRIALASLDRHVPVLLLRVADSSERH